MPALQPHTGTNRPELLAPAGDMESLRMAVLYGADAVYLGSTRFGMRSSPQNFDDEKLPEAVSFAHAHGVRVYLTCNTLPTNEDVDALPDHIRAAANAGVDALIVADIGVLMLAKRIAPQLSIHISTQAGVVNRLAATELYHLGASRVVLARELSLRDIAVIREKTPPELELEAFVHGAMCISFSGRCALSQYLVGRDANRGDCAQPCRWRYHVMEEKRDGLFFPVFEDEAGSWIFNAQDLCMLPHLDRVIEAGITSLKIEGRAKGAYYVAAVTFAYRQALDLYRHDPDHYDPPQWLLEETHKMSHRQYCTGFYFEDQPPGQYYENGYVRDWEVVATVEGWSDGFLRCIERNRFGPGERLEVLHPGGRPDALQVARILDEEGAELAVANHPMMRVLIPCETAYPAGSMLRRKTGDGDAVSQ